MVSVRVALRDDLAAVDALLARAYPRLLKPDYPPSILVTVVPLIARANPRLLASGTYYLAEADGAVLGAGGWSRGSSGGAELRHVVTDDRATRRGIGRAVMGHALDEARRAGCTRVRCLSTRTAVPFYTALGLEVVGPASVPIAPGLAFPAVEMRGRL